MRVLASAGLALSLLSSTASAKSVPYPVPEAIRSYYWSAQVDGKANGVCRARTTDAPFNIRSRNDHGGEYAVTTFAMEGPVRLVVRPVSGGAVRPIPALDKTEILPRTAPARIVRRLSDAVEIEVRKPCKFSIEPNGIEHPLIVLARAIEKDIPDPADPKVRAVGPGIVAPVGGLMTLDNGETLYLRPGTVLKSAISVVGKRDVRICGYGIIDGSDIPAGRTPSGRVILLERCRNVRVEGITIVGSWTWTLIPWGSEDIRIDDIAICGSRVWVDDGIDVVNSRRVHISDSFIRTDDDCFCLKGIDYACGDCAGVTVERCVLWGDRARVMLLGWIESTARRMGDLVFRDNDIIHFRGPAIMAAPVYGCKLENVLIDGLRIHNDREKVDEPVFRIFPSAIANAKIQGVKMSDGPGSIDGFVMRNVTIDGNPVELKCQYDDGHGAGKNLEFDKVTAFGTALELPQ